MRIVQLRPTRGSESTGDPVLRTRWLEWEEGSGNFQLVHETDRSLRLSVDAEGRVSVAPQRLGKSQTFEMRYLRDGVNVVAVPETNFALCVDERGALCCDTISKDMHNYLELATVGEVPNGDVRKRQPTVRQSDMTEEEFRAQLAKPLWYDLRSDLRDERKTFREEGKLLVESPQRRQQHATGRDSSPPTSPRSREGPPPAAAGVRQPRAAVPRARTRRRRTGRCRGAPHATWRCGGQGRSVHLLDRQRRSAAPYPGASTRVRRANGSPDGGRPASPRRAHRRRIAEARLHVELL
jgi:hypothetical protein